MTTISKEEENYVRQSMLLTGVAPRAVRVVFNREFPPPLKPFLVKHQTKIQGLNTKRVINNAQMTIINGASPVSDDFDITLMICFIRNFCSIPRSPTGFDNLPAPGDTSECADLARIKCYRNLLAHSDTNTIPDADFVCKWTEVSEAVGRLGGPSFKLECQNLHTAKLDQSNQQIMTEMKKSLKEIEELQNEMNQHGEEISYLKEEQSKAEERYQSQFLQLKSEQHDKLNDLQDILIKEIEKIRQSKQDVIPKAKRNIQMQLKEEWKEKLKKFVVTNSAKSNLETVKKEQCVLITGHSGAGKSATAYYIAYWLETHEGYDILSIDSPTEIIDFSIPEKKQLFLFDDVIGRYSLNDAEVNNWEKYANELEVHLKSKPMIKILMTCRLGIFEKCSNKKLGLPLTYCNLQSEGLQLSLEERKQIALSYLPEDSDSQLTESVITMYTFFPLLCQLYGNSPRGDISAFFKSPEEVIEREITEWKNKFDPSYFCLALLVIFNNSVDKQIFEIQNPDVKEIMEDVSKESTFQHLPSKTVLLSTMKNLAKTYLKVNDNSFQSIHDKVFEIIASIVGRDFKQCILQHGQSSFISERLQFDMFQTQKDEYKILLSKDENKSYFNRLLTDIKNGENWHVFGNCQTKFPNYRHLFLDFLKESRELSLSVGSDDRKTPALIVSVCFGYVDFCIFILNFNEQQLKITKSTDKAGHLLTQQSSVKQHDTNGNAQLRADCGENHTVIADPLPDHRAAVNQPDNEGLTPLHAACILDKKEIAELLLKHNASVNKTCNKGRPPLHYACGKGHKDIVELLIKYDTPINQTDSIGNTPLFVACSKGDKDVAEMLLTYHASINYGNIDGLSPLHVACSNGYKEVVELLLTHHALINQGNIDGWTPLHVACSNGHKEVVELLLTHHASTNQGNIDGWTPLHVACSNGHKEVVELLLTNHASINQGNINGWTPLHVACSNGHKEVLELLSTHHASINQGNIDGLTPLHVACSNGHKEVVELLLTHHALINQGNIDGWTPLHVACSNGHKEVVELLLRHHASINQTDNDGKTPLYFACSNGHIYVAADQADYKGYTPLPYACKNCNLGIVELLLTHQTSVNQTNNRGATPPHCGSSNGYKNLTELLLKYGATANQLADEGLTPLQGACQKRYKEVVELLLKNNASVNQPCYKGGTPIHHTCDWGCKDIVEQLIETHPPINQTDKEGRTPLHIACLKGRIDMNVLLLENIASSNQATNKKRTPLHVACSKGYKDISEFLLKHNANLNLTDNNGKTSRKLADEGGHTEVSELSKYQHTAEKEVHTDVSKILSKYQHTTDKHEVDGQQEEELQSLKRRGNKKKCHIM